MKTNMAYFLIGANVTNVVWCTVGTITNSPCMVIPLLGSVIVIIGCLFDVWRIKK